MPDPAVLTVAELAELLRVGRRQMYELIGRGQVPGVLRVGRSIRISSHAVDQWLNGTGHNGTEDEELTRASPPNDENGGEAWKAPPRP